ncbi:MAG: SRPBCC family protein [Paracoccaceae bacterium]|nr:MAG: SRPBCC family protein [Paracoccaceae bacterium]
MKLSTREDIEAPIGFVYAALADADHWERAALRRGAEVRRLDTAPVPGPGSTWEVGFAYRGRPMKVNLRVADLQPPTRMEFAGTGDMVQGTLSVDLVEMGPKRTRIVVGVEIKPQTLAARLFLQTLKLARKRVEQRFEMRMGQLAATVQERYRQSRPR